MNVKSLKNRKGSIVLGSAFGESHFDVSRISEIRKTILYIKPEVCKDAFIAKNNDK